MYRVCARVCMSGHRMSGWVSAVACERESRAAVHHCTVPYNRLVVRVGGQATRTIRCDVVQACKHACVETREWKIGKLVVWQVAGQWMSRAGTGKTGDSAGKLNTGQRLFLSCVPSHICPLAHTGGTCSHLDVAQSRSERRLTGRQPTMVVDGPH